MKTDIDEILALDLSKVSFFQFNENKFVIDLLTQDRNKITLRYTTKAQFDDVRRSINNWVREREEQHLAAQVHQNRPR